MTFSQVRSIQLALSCAQRQMKHPTILSSTSLVSHEDHLLAALYFHGSLRQDLLSLSVVTSKTDLPIWSTKYSCSEQILITLTCATLLMAGRRQ